VNPYVWLYVIFYLYDPRYPDSSNYSKQTTSSTNMTDKQTDATERISSRIRRW